MVAEMNRTNDNLKNMAAEMDGTDVAEIDENVQIRGEIATDNNVSFLLMNYF